MPDIACAQVEHAAIDRCRAAERDALPAHWARHMRSRHWTMLWLSTAVVAASFLLEANEAGRVGPAEWPGVELPELCMSRAVFGLECPGCGLTRSFIALAHGDVAKSLRYNRVGWVLALAVLAQFPYRILGLRELRAAGFVERDWPAWFGWMLIAALVGNWLGKVVEIW